jgi:hypothetical protein
MEIIHNQKRSAEKYYYFAIIGLWIIYALATFMAPAAVQTSGRYGLSTGELSVLRITVVLPFLFIWLSGVYAVLRFSRYLKYVSNSNESEGFGNIIYGLWLLLIVIIVPSFIGLITTYNPDSYEIQKTITIIRNYFNIVLYLSAFWFILKASRQLTGIAEINRSKKWKLIGVIGLGISILYVFLVFSNDYRGFSADSLIRPTYYLPDILIALTIILPYIVTWVLGLMAIYNIYFFSKHVSGVVYRKAFSWVAYGLGSITGLSIFLQFLSQSSAYFGRAGLSIILLIVYLLLIAIAIGYLCIAKGAKALTTIEEI